MKAKKTTYQKLVRKRSRRFWAILSLLILGVYFASISTKVNFHIFFRDNSQTFKLLSAFLTPKWEVLPKMAEAAMSTLFMALLGTLIGSFLSFLFAILAANNLSPRWSNYVARFLIALERAISEVLIVLFLIVIFGLGLFPGVLAIAISCIGMLGKLYADAFEEIPTKTLEAIRSTGATKAQLILFGVLPETAPSLIANTILRFEISIRASVLLGAIGAGGIGYELQKSALYVEYAEMTVAVLTILLLIFSAEQFSIWIRNRIIQNES